MQPGKRERNRRTESGIALIIVLLVIVVLGILAGGFAYSMKVETTLARHASFSSELDWLGRSGVEVAKWVISEGGRGPEAYIDSLKEKWAGGPGDTNDARSAIDLKNFEVGPGKLSLDILDADRKFNINMAAGDPVIMRQALTLIGVDAVTSSMIIDSVHDWRDEDDHPHPSGAETSAYEQQTPPYYAKNGPIDDLSELLLVRGVTPSIYWGAHGGGLPQIFNRGQGLFDEPSYAVGLVDLFTTLSAKSVNINTATPTVMQLLPQIDENIALAIVRARAGPDGVDGTDDDMPFRHSSEVAAKVPGLAGLGAAGLINRFFGVRSLVFEVNVVATAGSSRRDYVAILIRYSPEDIRIVNFYSK